MPDQLTQSEYYRRKAEESWDKAARMEDLAAKKAMEQVAASYGQLAELAARREAANSN